VACHRTGKENNNYLMTSYDEMLTTGDNKDHNIVAGDENSYLLQVIQGHAIPDPKDPSKEMIRSMPPNGHLKPDLVEAFMRWIMNGMPRTAEDATKLFVPPLAGPNVTSTP
jgi:hypothetical protein